MKYKQFYVDKHAAHSDWWVGTYIYETPISTINIAPRLRENVFNYGCKTMLDYGSGKGHQYTVEQYDKYIDVQVDMYDPGVPGIDTLQDKQYDAVLCMFVLPMVPEEEIDGVLTDIFSRATKFVAFGLVNKPSRTKTFDDGTNIVVSYKTEEEWRARIALFNTNNLPIDVLFVDW